MILDPGTVEKLGPLVGYVVAGASAVYGAVKAYVEGSGVISDWWERRHNPAGYKIKTTLDKSVIRTDRTECIRLRTVRANRKVSFLKMDHQPVIIRPGLPDVKAKISNYYALPGRATLTMDDMFQIDLMDDEILSAHEDHSVVLGYIMEEPRAVLFTPPGVIVEPPVGSDCLVIEVHFPGCVLAKNMDGTPQVKFYARDPRTKQETVFRWPSKRADVKWNEFDLNWIRAKITKPPRDREICLDWQWQCP